MRSLHASLVALALCAGACTCVPEPVGALYSCAEDGSCPLPLTCRASDRVCVLTEPTKAQLSLAPQAADAGAVPLGEAGAELRFTVSNSGGSPTGSLQATLSGQDSDQFALLEGECAGSTLGQGEGCALTVRFVPTSPGPKSAALEVTASPGGTVGALLEGLGRDLVTLTVSIDGGVGDGLVSALELRCEGTCQARYERGQELSLVAVTQDGTTELLEWAGDCSGAWSHCDLVMDQDKSVGASFLAFTRAAQKPLFAFLTSRAHVMGEIGGLSAADTICNADAADAGLPGNFVAWLSSDSVDAVSRLPPIWGGWVRRDGRPLADSIQALTEGRVLYPPRLDAHGSPVLNSVLATGTLGTGLADQGRTCDGWTNPASDGGARIGATRFGTSGWTQAGIYPCTASARFVCFQAGFPGPVSQRLASARAAPHRLIFATASTLVPGGGLSAADELCVSEAGGGDFQALLTSTTAGALGRFTEGSPPRPIRRPDGVLVAEDLHSLGKNLLHAPPNVTLDGGYVSAGAWTGGPPGDGGVPADTCDDWSSNDASKTGRRGPLSSSGSDRFNGPSGPVACSNAHRLLCLER